MERHSRFTAFVCFFLLALLLALPEMARSGRPNLRSLQKRIPIPGSVVTPVIHGEAPDSSLPRIPVDNMSALYLRTNRIYLSFRITFSGPSSCSHPIRFQETLDGRKLSVVMYREPGGTCTQDTIQQQVTYEVQSTLRFHSYDVDVNGCATILRIRYPLDFSRM